MHGRYNCVTVGQANDILRFSFTPITFKIEQDWRVRDHPSELYPTPKGGYNCWVTSVLANENMRRADRILTDGRMLQSQF